MSLLGSKTLPVLYGIRGIAKRANCSTSVVSYSIKIGRISPVAISDSGRLLFSESDVARYIATYRKAKE